jgi:hypothetical protein
MVAVWPMPTVLGTTVQYAVVGIVQGGVCALVCGVGNVAVIIANVRMAIAIAATLFFENFTLFLLMFRAKKEGIVRSIG